MTKDQFKNELLENGWVEQMPGRLVKEGIILLGKSTNQSRNQFLERGWIDQATGELAIKGTFRCKLSRRAFSIEEYSNHTETWVLIKSDLYRNKK